MDNRKTLFYTPYDLIYPDHMRQVLEELKMYDYMTHSVDILLVRSIMNVYDIEKDSVYYRMLDKFNIVDDKLKGKMTTSNLYILKFYIYMCNCVERFVKYVNNVNFKDMNIENVFLFALKKSRYISGSIEYTKAPFGEITNKLIMSKDILSFKVKDQIIIDSGVLYDAFKDETLLMETIENVKKNVLEEATDYGERKELYKVDNIEIVEIIMKDAEMHDLFFKDININDNFDFGVISDIFKQVRGQFIYEKEFLSLDINKKFFGNVLNKDEALFMIYMMYITKNFIIKVIRRWGFTNYKLFNVFNEYSIQNLFFTVTHYPQYKYFVINLDKEPFNKYMIELFGLDLYSRPIITFTKKSDVEKLKTTNQKIDSIRTIAYGEFTPLYINKFDNIKNNETFVNFIDRYNKNSNITKRDEIGKFLEIVLDDVKFLSELEKKPVEEQSNMDKYILLNSKLKKYQARGDKYYIEPPIDFRTTRICVPGDRTKNLSLLDKIAGDRVTMTYASDSAINTDSNTELFIQLYESIVNKQMFQNIYGTSNQCYVTKSTIDGLRFINNLQ